MLKAACYLALGMVLLGILGNILGTLALLAGQLVTFGCGLLLAIGLLALAQDKGNDP